MPTPNLQFSGVIIFNGSTYAPRLAGGQYDLPEDCPLSGPARSTARQWAAEWGVNVATARASTLRSLWNCTSYDAATRIALESGADAIVDADPAPAPMPPKAEPVTPKGNLTRAELLATLLEGGITEERVIQLVREHAPKPDGATRIEVKVQPEPTPRPVELAHRQFPEVMDELSMGHHVYLVGPAGTGKSSIIRQAAKLLGAGFASCCALQSASELLGFRDGHGNYAPTPFRNVYENGGIMLYDEADSSDARALNKFNQALDRSETYAFPDGMVRKHRAFVVGMTANTWGLGATAEYVGRTRIDGATMNRLVQIFIDYDENLELAMLPNNATVQSYVKKVQALRKAADKLKIKHLISPRQSEFGADAIIHKGYDIETCLVRYVRNSLDNVQWLKLRTEAGV